MGLTQENPQEAMETAARPYPTPTTIPGPSPATRTSPHAPLRTGWPTIDELDLIRPGELTLVDIGSEPGQRVLCRLLANAVATRGEATILDGGNWTDVYRLGHEAEAMGHSRNETLRGVRVARGFTAYQLQSLIENALAPSITHSTGLILAPCFPEMYLDEDLKPDEARALSARALKILREAAIEHDVPVVVSNSTLAPGAKHRLRDVLEQGADEIVGLFPAPHGALRVSVPRRGMSVLAPAPGALQSTLEKFDASAVATGPPGVFMRTAPDAQIRYLPKRAGEMRHAQKQKAVA